MVESTAPSGSDMVTCEWLEEEIRGVIPDCNVEAVDLNGTQDHFHIRIIAESFDGVFWLFKVRNLGQNGPPDPGWPQIEIFL